MVPTRRRLLQAAALTTSGALAGCTLLSTRSAPMVSVALENETDTRYAVDVALFEAGADQSLGEARVYDRTEIAVPPGETVTREAIADQRRYLIRYRVATTDGVQTDTGHVHSYPREDEPDTVAFELTAGGTLTRFA
ncbi:MAG: hypothetical protein ABEJ57_04210 [Halobacteriaceae archaeon]